MARLCHIFCSSIRTLEASTFQGLTFWCQYTTPLCPGAGVLVLILALGILVTESGIKAVQCRVQPYYFT
jgi:hypothetical protein